MSTWSNYSPQPQPPRRPQRRRSPLLVRLTPPLLVVALMWIVFALELVAGPEIVRAGSIPSGDFSRPWTWFTAVFIHLSTSHIAGNTPFMLVLGILIGLEGVGRWAGVSLFGVIGGGIGATVLSTNTLTAGASGVIYCYLGYLLAAAFTEKNLSQKVWRIVVAAAILFFYSGTIIYGFIPHAAVSWQCHLGGFIGGILAAIVFEGREARRARSYPA
ncbi:MAG: rhomboid family intramembrane serine protease [Actinomycetaceae bacterium]|nr:rhomboid family intramembrane serine protease [Actinomycetaceae bacterium]MDU0970780.1 rhomboid family intramembrane serine protease [Actinomycetaceae bacterium]